MEIVFVDAFPSDVITADVVAVDVNGDVLSLVFGVIFVFVFGGVVKEVACVVDLGVAVVVDVVVVDGVVVDGVVVDGVGVDVVVDGVVVDGVGVDVVVDGVVVDDVVVDEVCTLAGVIVVDGTAISGTVVVSVDSLVIVFVGTCIVVVDGVDAVVVVDVVPTFKTFIMSRNLPEVNLSPSDTNVTSSRFPVTVLYIVR